MEAIQFESEVGSDGVLSLRVPLRPVDANTRVIVTIQPLVPSSSGLDEEQQDWHSFVQRTYGSCAALGLEEPADLPLPAADWPS
jgi:hypothetical protein